MVFLAYRSDNPLPESSQSFDMRTSARAVAFARLGTV
jgi:hypothetical protein